MKVLITGGTGYLGRALTRHLLGLPDTDTIRIYSRGEAKQAEMRQELESDRLRFLVGDVRDRDRLTTAMRGVDLVIHTAALKRVEVGEYCPTEMVQTNVHGTMNVLQSATDARVRNLVVLSSDKACAPLNAYGATKLVAEKLALSAMVEHPEGPKIAVTRYGNVAGSTGSVIPTWRARIAAGKPIVMTDPAATRFWMSVDQACDLVLDACFDQWAGCLLVPSLKAYMLENLMLAMVPRAWDVEETMLGPGEKRHEEMISEPEAQGFSRIEDLWVRGPACGMQPRRTAGLRSDQAPLLSVNELKRLLQGIR